MAIVAIFREPILQGFHLLTQAAYLLTQLLDQGVLLAEQRLLLLDEFVSLRQLLSQSLILFSQIDQFFFNRERNKNRFTVFARDAFSAEGDVLDF